MSEVSSASVGETPAIKALCEEFRNLNPKMVAIKARLDFIRKNLIGLSNGKTVLSSGVKVSTSPRKGAIDYGSIMGIQKMTEDGSIEKYRKEASTVSKIQVVG